MFVQLFRNKIYESRKLKYRIRRLEDSVWDNRQQSEVSIVRELVRLWNSQGSIDLGSFNYAGRTYEMFAEFYQLMTHGRPHVEVRDKILVGSNKVEYKTEFGDLALIVDYWLEHRLLSRRISILQCKKEKALDQVDIDLHQLYLMQFWPDVEVVRRSSYLTEKYSFPNVRPDEFSFYHFILNQHKNPEYSSSLCSAPFVGTAMNENRASIEKSLLKWLSQRKTGNPLKPPSKTLSLPLEPGSIYRHGKYYEWNLLFKPLNRFLLDAAYQHIGTDHVAVTGIAFWRVGNVVALKVTGGREADEWRNSQMDIYESKHEKEQSK